MEIMAIAGCLRRRLSVSFLKGVLHLVALLWRKRRRRAGDNCLRLLLLAASFVATIKPFAWRVAAAPTQRQARQERAKIEKKEEAPSCQTGNVKITVHKKYTQALLLLLLFDDF